MLSGVAAIGLMDLSTKRFDILAEEGKDRHLVDAQTPPMDLV